MYKALITDLDGTAVPLTSDGREITNSTQTAVHDATERGFLLACATGRHWEYAEPVIKRLGFTAPSIIEGGTRIVDASGRTLWEKALSTGVATDVLAIFKDAAPHAIFMSSIDSGRYDLAKIHTLPDHMRFMYAIGVPAEAGAAIIRQINGKMPAVVHVTPSWDGGELLDVHVTHTDGTKEHAVKVWQDLQKVTIAETVGMGDAGNDLPIFAASGLKIAVENASPELKSQADYIAPPVTDQALEHVIRKFFLAPTAPTKPSPK